MANLKASEGNSVIRVLHVDDDSSVLEISKLILMEMGSFEIDSARCVNEAFNKLSAKQYDAVISDYEMPEKDGLEFLKELRDQKNEIPFILFTGKGREEVAIRALNLGSDAYINKQGNPETVYGELSHSLIKTIERKTSKRLLSESEARYRKLVEDSLQGILITSANPLRLVFANEAIGKILGYSEQELLVLTPEGIANLVHHEDREVFFRRMEKRLKGEPAESFYEFRAIQKDGSTVWLYASANRVIFNGELAVQGVFLNTTEHKHAEEALVRSEERYRMIAENAQDIITVTDLNGVYFYVSPSMEKVFGYSANELIGQNAFDLIHPEDVVTVVQPNLPLLLKGGEIPQVEFRFKANNGSYLWLEGNVQSVKDSKGNINLLVVSRNIQERKKSKELLAQSEAKYRKLVENSQEGIAINQISPLKFIFANSAMGKILGYSPYELVALSPQEIRKRIHPDDQETFFDRFRKRIGGKEIEPNYQFRGIQKDGSIRWLEVRSNLIEFNGQLALQGVFLDITERKKTDEDLKKNHSKLEVVNEKLRVVGGLTRHDVRNRLSGINGYTYLMKRRFSDNAELMKFIEQINSTVNSTVHLLDFAAMYEKIGSENSRMMNVGQCFKETLNLFADLKKIEVVNECDGLEVNADSLLKQLFYNLIDNSLKHGEKVTCIKLRYEEDSAGLKVVYEDNGVGIPHHNKPKLFHEGFTTGRGTGHGLFLIKKMTEVYGWQVQETGEPGEGSKFVISIPLPNSQIKSLVFSVSKDETLQCKQPT